MAHAVRKSAPFRSGHKAQAERRDHYQELTNSIVAALEDGRKPWVRPWNPDLAGGPSMPVNAATGRRYHGVNVLILAIAAFARGGDPRWCTYRQAAERGWQVRGGETATTVFFFKKLTVIDNDKPQTPEGDDATRTVPLLRAYSVFNASQIDGIPAYVPPAVADCPWLRPDAASLILRNSGATFREGGERAFYSPGSDFVQMPPEGCFATAGGWAATLLHELGHWTGHKSRLDRDLQNRFGSGGYAQEELRAELASVFMGAELGLPCEIANHASYIGGWIEKLRQDKREIFRAASDAQRISDFLLAFHPDFAAAVAAEQPAIED